VTATTGNVSLTATDDSDIDARSYVVSASVTAAGKGAAVAGSTAIAVANNLLNSTVETFIGQAGSGLDSTRITAQNLTLNASATTDIDAEVVSASFALGAALVGVGVSISGAVAENRIGNTVESALRNGSTLDIANNVNATATDTSTIDATYGVGSFSFGTATGISVGFASTENVLSNQISA